ncbi:MAG: hypothetical protein WCH04_10080 [Gammaproteobacteria bacterium]
MTYLLLLLMAVVFVVAFWLWQHRAKINSFSRVAADSDSSNYHCVVITYGKNPCDAVKRLESKRFLSTEAPALKLPGCTADSCQCRYVHYEDRREEERRNPYGKYSSTSVLMGQERREQTGRRNSDVMELDDIGHMGMSE